MHKSQQALLHAKSTLHEHKRRSRDHHHQDGATTTTTTSASSPSAIKASSPLDVRHLRLLPTCTPTSTSSSPRRPPTSEGDTSIFGSPSRMMVEHGKFPSVMETSYEVPHHMGLQQQDDRARAIPFDHGDEREPLQHHEDGAHIGLILRVKLHDRA